MKDFVFKWKRSFFWYERRAVGFNYQREDNRMQLYFEDGSIFEIPEWNKCHCELGTDFHQWLLHKKELEAGQKIPTAVVH